MKFAKRRRFSASAFASSASRPDFAVSTRHQPRQDDAMPDDSRNLGDESRVRGRPERGMRDPIKHPRRPLSPLQTSAPHAAAAPREREAGRRRDLDIVRSPLPTDRDRSHRNTRPGERPRSPSRLPHSAHPYRRKPRNYSRGRAERPGDLFPRHKQQGPRGTSWGREAAPPTDPHQPPPHQSRAPHTDEFDRQPSRPRSSPPAKRLRSRSPLSSATYSRRSRHEPSPRRFEGEPDAARASPYPPRPETSSSRRERSLTRRERRSKKKTSGIPPPISRGRSPPPRPRRDFPDNPNLCPLGQRASPHRDHSPWSFSSRRLPSSPPRREGPPPPLGRRGPSIPDTLSRGGRTPVYDRERRDHSRQETRSPSPRDRRASFSSKRQRRLDHFPPREVPTEPASGSNSIEINMSARGNFRGSYSGQYSGRGHYSQGPHSSGHATPNSSFHGTPPAQSPYSGGRGSWGGQQQYSPQQSQYPPQFQTNGYAPTAPAAHFQGNQANSPPVGTPTGPSHQFSQSPYRGGYRGSSSGGYRGNSAGPGRGANRGGFKSGHWGSSGSGSRAASSQPEDAGSGHATPQAGSSVGDQGSVHGDVGTHEPENPFRPPKEFQVEDTTMDEGNDEQPMLPPTSRPPPTGPAAEKKISFALKSTPKAPVTAPKFDISSKFNAPTKKDPPKESSRHDPRDRERRDSRDNRDTRDTRDTRDNRDNRDNRDSRDVRDSRDNRDSRDTKSSREHREPATPKHVADGRDLPRNVPTEPRAAKEQQRRQEQQKPREPREPRVRMVKKKMKRLKEKPKLPDHLVGSDSVYFRKPGNESVIGAGTYGKVFKALHVYTKNLVALKRIRMEGERDGFPVTAVREIKLLQSLKHINIVALLEVMVEKNECYMVFEYMSHDLTGILNHPTFKLEAAHRKHLSKQLFEGLDYLHQRGVLHRDIKAANILVSSDGILKLADFGLARFYAKRHQLDYTNRVITIWYRSPELLLGETQYSPAVDIWSAACVMIEIFTRRAIFPGDGGEISQLDKIYSVLGTPHKSNWPGLLEMPWFELLRPGVRKPNVFAEQYEERLPPAAFKLLAEMLQYDPDKRPTAAQVLEHPYFTTESPAPRQVVELQHVDGDWHEFESKALRRENERKDREARKAAEKGSGTSGKDNRDSRKRPPEANDTNREPKRQHVEKKPSEATSTAGEVVPTKKA